MKLLPPENKLLVELIRDEIVRESGIVITDGLYKDEEVHPHSIHLAKVIAIGRECKYIEIGDQILLEHCYTRPFSFRDMEYKIIKEPDIVGRTYESNARGEVSTDVGAENTTIGIEGSRAGGTSKGTTN